MMVNCKFALKFCVLLSLLGAIPILALMTFALKNSIINMLFLRRDCSKIVFQNRKKLSLLSGCYRHNSLKFTFGVHLTFFKHISRDKISFGRDFREYCAVDNPDDQHKGGKEKKRNSYPYKLRTEIINLVRKQDFVEVMRLCKEIRTAQLPKNFKLHLYTYILSACCKGPHLQYALEVKAELESLCFQTSGQESTILPLIRCYCDNGEIGNSIDSLKSTINTFICS